MLHISNMYNMHNILLYYSISKTMLLPLKRFVVMQMQIIK